jgi:hypothetical protein
MGEAFLSTVKIDRGDALAGLEQCYCNMQRRGGFSRTTLLAREYDHVCGSRSFLNRLNQHDASFNT